MILILLNFFAINEQYKLPSGTRFYHIQPVLSDFSEFSPNFFPDLLRFTDLICFIYILD